MDKIVQNYANYEIRIDIKKLFKTFNVGDVILLANSIDPFQILKKLNCHIYVIDFGISSIFNIEDLMDYKSFNFNSSNFFIDEPFLRDFPFHQFQIFYLIQWIRLIKFWMMKLS